MNSPADVNNVHPGDLISIQVGGLNTCDHFKYRITSIDHYIQSNPVSLSGCQNALCFHYGYIGNYTHYNRCEVVEQPPHYDIRW